MANHTNSLAILIYGDASSNRNALTEEKYKDLAEAFLSAGFAVDSVLYHDAKAEQLAVDLLQYDAILVWVNPIEQGNNRKRLDALLHEISDKGCFVSTHPEVILKMGTKEVLYITKDMEWGCDINLYKTSEDFKKNFPSKLKSTRSIVLKQYRGNGGNGVYKIVYDETDNSVRLTHAITANKEDQFTFDQLFAFLEPFFNDGFLISQEWNKNTVNGMVRCYVSGTKVCGFGYQEINALYELNNSKAGIYFPPSKRYYFTEHCGLFSDLRTLMEDKWIHELQNRLSIADEKMPVIWDADFFINNNDEKAKSSRYTLCEINVSCVSPFPPSSIPFIVGNVSKLIAN
jgi:hypothetical protein